MRQVDRGRRASVPGVAGVSLVRRAALARQALRREASFNSETVIFLAVILQSVTDLAGDDAACRDSARCYLAGEYPFADHARAVGLDPLRVRVKLEQGGLLPICGCRVA